MASSLKKISLFILSLVFVAALFSSGFCQAENPGKKAVMLIAHQGFQDDEFVVPKKILEQNGINVTVASTDLGMAAGMNGMKVKPDILVILAYASGCENSNRSDVLLVRWRAPYFRGPLG